MRIFFSTLVLVSGLTGCMNLVVRDVKSDPIQVKIGNSHYRLAESAQTAMLQIGNKGDQAFSPLFRPTLSESLKIQFVTEASIETSSKGAYNAAVKLGVPAVNVSAGITTERSDKRTAKLIVTNVIDLLDLARELESPENQRNMLTLDLHTRPRIVTALVTVEELSSDRSSGMTGRLGADYKATGKVTVGGTLDGGGGATRLETLSKGTIYAYQLSRICWANSNGQAKVAIVVPDRIGAGGGCPEGTYDNLKKLFQNVAAKQ